ncbi:hypothetical protein TNCV_4293421 [Trichonephila clavipes]|uniref:Uncharacterized protein n=1 Tax=Trichonephila clavipes TaxID=2585209 RepID=A0A8X6RKG9_TRICX|nr:hypothetical protein TNCV_4293421 [Trichonephila clavipes]
MLWSPSRILRTWCHSGFGLPRILLPFSPRCSAKRKSYHTKRFPFWETEDIEIEPTLNEMLEKISVLLDCPTVSSEEFVAVDDDNLRVQPQLWQVYTSIDSTPDVDSFSHLHPTEEKKTQKRNRAIKIHEVATGNWSRHIHQIHPNRSVSTA